MLVVQLKRFGYDWEANRAIKFDDFFEVRLESWREEGREGRRGRGEEGGEEIKEEQEHRQKRRGGERGRSD